MRIGMYKLACGLRDHWRLRGADLQVPRECTKAFNRFPVAPEPNSSNDTHVISTMTQLVIILNYKSIKIYRLCLLQLLQPVIGFTNEHYVLINKIFISPLATRVEIEMSHSD